MTGKVRTQDLRNIVQAKVDKLAAEIQADEDQHAVDQREALAEDVEEAKKALDEAKAKLAASKKAGWKPEPVRVYRYSRGRQQPTKEERLGMLHEALVIIDMLVDDEVKLTPELERLIGWKGPR